jgi:hypothetical protein
MVIALAVKLGNSIEDIAVIPAIEYVPPVSRISEESMVESTERYNPIRNGPASTGPMLLIPAIILDVTSSPGAAFAEE